MYNKMTKDGRMILPSGSLGGEKQIICTKCLDTFVICADQHWNAPKYCPDCREILIGSRSDVTELYLRIS
jgi:predicted transcriptional regulator